MAIKKYTLTDDSRPTTEQIKMLDEASEKPIVFDEDCPELTDEQLAELREIFKARAEERRKQNITLRLSPSAIRKAKSLGKGYTSILSRIVEHTLNDPNMLSRFL